MSNSVPEGWVESSLGNIADIRFSNVDKKSDFENEEPVKLCNYMDVYSNSKITNSLPFMQATAKDREIKKFSLLKNDVIITKDSETPDDIAVSAYVSEDLKSVVCGYHLAMLRPEQSLISGEYLNHLFGLDDIQHYFYLLANGITRFGLTTDAINNAYIIYPPLPEQKKIAAILTSVDTVIEKTQAQIDKLKDLKTGMMQELLTKGIGHTEFKDSPVGWIPVEWEVDSIESFGISILDGDRGKEYPKEKDFFQNEYCLFLSAKNVTKHGFKFNETVYITKKKDDLLRKGKLIRNDIVITTRGTVGNIALYDDSISYNHIRINSGMAIIRNQEDKLDTEYLNLVLHSPLVCEQIELLAFGSAQPQLTIGLIKNLFIPKPDIEEQNKISKSIGSIQEKISIVESKLKSLQNTKKALMQDLLTGKVRLKV